MPKLYSSSEVIKVLGRQGFIFVSQRGSHCKYRRRYNGETRTVIVPVGRKEIPHGTFNSILRQSGLPKKYFPK